MKKKRKVILIVSVTLFTLCLCLFAIGALGSKANKAETSKVSGQQNGISGKATLINESSPTASITIGPTSTLTSTPTPVDTPTPTATIPPATETAIAIQFTKTAAADAKNATATVISKIATSTRVAYEKKATATAQSISLQKTLVGSYEEIYWKELITYPDNHKGEKVVVRGRIFNINGDEQLQIYLAGTYEAVYVVMEKSFRDLYDNDSITIYGVIDGENCGTNAFGGEVCQPLIIDAWYTKP